VKKSKRAKDFYAILVWGLSKFKKGNGCSDLLSAYIEQISMVLVGKYTKGRVNGFGLSFQKNKIKVIPLEFNYKK